jgi:hypothetical protein
LACFQGIYFFIASERSPITSIGDLFIVSFDCKFLIASLIEISVTGDGLKANRIFTGLGQ